jgi:cytochrome c oxidase assembly factor 1
MRPLSRGLRYWGSPDLFPTNCVPRSFSHFGPLRESRSSEREPTFSISTKRFQRQPRPLPAYSDVRPKTGRNTAIFLCLCGAWAIGSIVAINYERSVSPVTASVLHEVRKSSKANELLGNDIQHRASHPEYRRLSRFDSWMGQPWISGSIQLTKGVIDISFDVKGSSRTWSLKYD